MLINELYEAGGFWKGVGQSLAQRYTPGFDFSKTSYNTGPKLRQAAAKAGQFVGRATVAAPTAQPQVPTSPVPPATDYAQYQTPTVFRKPPQQAHTAISPTPATTPVQATAATPTAAPAPTPAAKPRVITQPIRVGNKVYRPGDPMHARLSQMMQAQKKT